jgi:hypothetical protein
MNVHPDIAEFVANLEVFRGRKLHYPWEVGELLQIVLQTGLTNEFEDLIFQAKFLTRAQEVMKKIGFEAEGFDKLSAEFQSELTRSRDLLKILLGRTTEDIMRKYSDTFFTMETEGLFHLMQFYSDLSWIKNWQIDGRPLPYERELLKTTFDQEPGNRQIHEKQKSSSTNPLIRIQRSAMLGLILFVLFLLIDPPVTILGWIISLWIAALLVYIVLQISFFHRSKNAH